MKSGYLITGGAGFIGCALAQQLLNRPEGRPEAAILAIDCLHPQVHPRRTRPTALPAAVDLCTMDVCDAHAWDTLLAQYRPTAVIHLAAETGTAQSLDLPTRHTHTNATGTAQMVEAFARARFVPEHIVLASSRAVYGEGRWRDPADGRAFVPGHRSPERMLGGEYDILAPSGLPAQPLPQDAADTSPRPTSIYGVTKLAQESILELWSEARNVPLTILRLQNVYGPGQSPHNPYTGMVGLFHRVAAAGGSIEVYEDGLIGRDFIYVGDVARCIAAALANPPAERRLLDVGSGEALTVLEVARSIADLYGAPPPRVSGAFRIGDVRWAQASTAKLEAELGCFRSVPFAEGNRHLSNWLREFR